MNGKTTKNNSENKLKSLQDDNKLLLSQLHQVQEELEVYYLKCKDFELKIQNKCYGSNIHSYDMSIKEDLSELERLKFLILVNDEIEEIKINNSLNLRLGNMLVEASVSPVKLIKFPFKILSLWRHLNKPMSLEDLVGNNFSALLETYSKQGLLDVKKMFKRSKLNLSAKADVYTIIARNLIQIDCKICVDAAYKAYEADPKPYRLKWLAFRIYEAGDILKAESILDILFGKVSFSDSEENLTKQIRYEATKIRNQMVAERINKSMIDHEPGKESECAEYSAADKTHENSKLTDNQKNHSLVDSQLELNNPILTDSKMFNSEISSLKNSVRFLNEENLLLQEQIKKYEDEMVDLKIDSMEKIDKIKSLDSNIKISQKNIEELNKENKELQLVIRQLGMEKSHLINEINEKKGSLEEIKSFSIRKKVINEEMVRAEAQIDLIKDLILRERK